MYSYSYTKGTQDANVHKIRRMSRSSDNLSSMQQQNSGSTNNNDNVTVATEGISSHSHSKFKSSAVNIPHYSQLLAKRLKSSTDQMGTISTRSLFNGAGSGTGGSLMRSSNHNTEECSCYVCARRRLTGMVKSVFGSSTNLNIVLQNQKQQPQQNEQQIKSSFKHLDSIINNNNNKSSLSLRGSRGIKSDKSERMPGFIHMTPGNSGGGNAATSVGCEQSENMMNFVAKGTKDAMATLSACDKFAGSCPLLACAGHKLTRIEGCLGIYALFCGFFMGYFWLHVSYASCLGWRILISGCGLLSPREFAFWHLCCA
ncbi:uncharacterized protein LOC142338182 [Convolutriloba macropyga]|uniref:uncharacterized protein LOC142338182 n=1 Tax=Convolutriloba macropyga TaxID=536237 RepID=UPI003F52111A